MKPTQNPRAPVKLRRRARALAVARDATPIDLAEALYEAEQAAPGAIQELIEDGVIRQRRAYYLKSIWARLVDLQIPKARLVKIGWTKLAVIVSKCPEGDELEWLQIAEEGTPAADLVRAAKGKDEAARHSILLRMTDAQHKVFEKALRRFGAVRGRTGRGLTKKEAALTLALKEVLKVPRQKAVGRDHTRASTSLTRGGKSRL